MMPNTQYASTKIHLKDYLDRSERGDAELLAILFADQILFDHTEKSWYVWRGAYWEKDRIGEVFGKLDVVASKYLLAASQTITTDKDLSERYVRRANSLRTNKRMKNVLDIASRLPEFAFTGDKWDSGSMILPVANGIVNLTDGSLYISKPTDYIRTFCPVDWIGLDAPAPLWEKSLQDIFSNIPELISFIGRVFGYGITGETKEQKLPIFWGEGSNGKGVIMDTIIAVLGSGFCFNVQSEVLMESRMGESNGAKPFVVSLRSKRIVFASETKEGQKLNDGLVKQLTGDGYITARTLHEKPITFAQTHKIILITNHLPAIPDAGDYAIWRRVIRIPFTVVFKENPTTLDERPLDIDLVKKLKAEYSGILAWLVRGCLDWQTQGLNPPDIVNKSTKDYQVGEDLALQFCTECIKKDPTKFITAGALYHHFTQWCDSTGDKPVGKKEFGKKVIKLYGKAIPQRAYGKVQKVYVGIDVI